MPLRKIVFILSLLLAMAVFNSCSTPLSSSVPVTQNKAEKTLFAVYMVGSDLEDDLQPRNHVPDEQELGGISKIGAGSIDIKEMLLAWEQMSDGEKSHIDTIVAFGGARKEGWQGVKYADLPCLSQDAEDGYFGNDSCYLEQQNDFPMSTEESLSHFLDFLDQHYAEHGRKIFQFWNHGLSYLGVGYDSSSLESKDYITLPEIRHAFKTNLSHFDLVGFDACLMASLEVAQTMAPYADYMLASEELEPGHGWQYTDVLEHLVRYADKPVTDLGEKLVDSFLDHASHQSKNSNYKTLSLLDLKHVDTLVSEIDQLVSGLGSNHFEALLQALQAAQRFGEEPRNHLDYAVDFKDWVQHISQNVPETQVQAESAIRAAEDLVLYSRHDSAKPNAYGISIYSLNARMKKNYGLDQAVSSDWLDFAGTFVATGSNDSISPKLSVSDFSAAQERPDNLCQQKNQEGHCFRSSDNLGVKSVQQVFALKADPRYFFKVGSERLANLGHDNYFAPIWNGEWFLLCDGNCKTGLSLFPPAYYVSETENKGRIYASEAQLNGLDVVFYLEVGQNNAVVNHWAIPYEMGDQGEVILARDQMQIGSGDEIAFYYQVYDLQENTQAWKKGQSLKFSSEPSWDFAIIDASRTYFVQAEDYNGNLAVSDLYQIGS